MQTAGPWRVASPTPRTRYLARCQPDSRPSSISVANFIADSRGPELEEVALTECLSPPPLSCSNSTLSLLSPLGRQSFPFGEDDSEGEDEEALDEDTRVSEAKVERLEGMELKGCSSCEPESQDKQVQKQVQLRESSLTPWEIWFVGKEKEERGRLQQKVLEELNQQIEKIKEMEEREKRKIIAEEKHKEWVQKKNEQERKEREQKINKEMEEKAAKKLAKEYLQEKAKEKYQEWLKKKNAEKCEKKKKEKEKKSNGKQNYRRKRK